METSSQKSEANAWLGSEGTKEHYANFDWLRLLMAIQVVAIHSGVTSSVFMNPVPAFLAISGFVVLGSMERRPIGQFFISRALRVLPLLIVSFIAVGVLKGRDEMLKNILYWLWPSGQAPVNAVVWSLMYEEILYILLACLFLLGAYKRKILPCLICALTLLTEVYVTNVLPPRLWYFLGGAFFIGNVMYIYRHYFRRFVNKWVAATVFAVAVYFAYNMPYADIIRPGFTDFFSFAAMILFAIAGPQLPRLKVDISYSLYLLHCIVREQFWGLIGFGTIGFFGAVLFSTIPLCFLAWYGIEKPALSLKSKLSNARGRQLSLER